MPDDEADAEQYPIAANDNRGAGGPDPEVLRKVDQVALRLARIIGKRMAREDFDKAVHADNDNTPAADTGKEP